MSAVVEIDTEHRRGLFTVLSHALAWDEPAQVRRSRLRHECHAAAAPKREIHPGLVAISVMLATIMQALDTTIANVALPHMQGSLAATQDQISWVLTSYIVAAAIAMPATGFIAAKIGRKRLLLISISGFIVTSMLCGVALSLEQMVVYRLLQGIFGASLVPLSQSVLLDSYPKEKHGAAMAMWGVGVMVGPILGPTLGGYLTENFDWRWVFFINLPFGLLALAGVMAFVSEIRAPRQAALRCHGLRVPGPCHRRAADDAGPRRAAGLVRLDRDHRGGGDRRPRLLSVRGAHVHAPRAVPGAAAVPGPQLRGRHQLHVRGRHHPARHHDAAAADAAAAGRASRC